MIGLREAVRTSTKSKLVAYKGVNPDLNVHKVYGEADSIVPKCHKIVFSRLRLVSHNLRIEIGTWARLQNNVCVNVGVFRQRTISLLTVPYPEPSVTESHTWWLPYQNFGGTTQIMMFVKRCMIF